MPCPELEYLERLAEGKLSADDSAPIERHIAQCGECRSQFEQIKSNLLLARRVADAERLVVQPESPKETAALPAHLSERLTSAIGEQAGDMIGPYRLLSMLGEGGFGVVWLAERREPHVQRVALKIIKPGMDSRAVIARFEQERQALAVMDHPNVAKVYDAGATSGGRPYFVMEAVQGESITHYCDRHTLTIRQRLELFIPVCEAVQHAHHKGIIHRDIKPSNILVMIRDGQPIPKVIDFGVAKAISQTLTEKTIFTEQGQIIGTPEYMSPEQAEMGAVDIDTRTDVYSLGVVLYELLTGLLPFDPKSLRAAGYAEVQRIIREEEPPKPSTRITRTDDATGAGIAKRRQSEREDLSRELRRELDWIPLKALRKDRAHRYDTPLSLARDIQRYLLGEALEAGPESTRYRLRKFAHRNRGSLAAVTVIGVSLCAGLGGTFWQARLAREQAKVATANAEKAKTAEKEEKDRADELEKVAEFQAEQLSAVNAANMGVWLREDLLEKKRATMTRARYEEPEIVASIEQLDRSLSGISFTDVSLALLDRNVFDGALSAVASQFADQPLVKARLLQSIADTMHSLGLLERAFVAQSEALDILTRLLGDEHPHTLQSMSSMGSILKSQGKLEQAEPYILKALDKQRQVVGENNPETLRSINNMGMLLQAKGRLKEAEALLQEVLDKSRSIFGDQHPNTLIAMNNMGILLQAQGRLDKAGLIWREVLEMRRRVLGEQHPDTLHSINSMGMLFLAQRKLDQAESNFREALEGRRRVLGEDHPDTLLSMSNMGWALHVQGKLPEAESFYIEALERRRRVLGKEHPNTLTSMENLSRLLIDTSRYAEAVALLVPAESDSRRAYAGADASPLASFLLHLGIAQTGTKDFASAESTLLEAFGTFQQTNGAVRATASLHCMQALAHLHEKWHAAESNKGHDAKAAEWRARIAERRSVRPATTQSTQSRVDS